MSNLRNRTRAILLGLVVGSAFPVLGRELTIEDRFAAQRAIEVVYYAHQLDATRSFDEAVPRSVIEKKVRTYLKQSLALETFWSRALGRDDLRLELTRIARSTLLPDRLNELYAALGNDAFLIEECLARPVLVDRLVRGFFASDVSSSLQVGNRIWDDWWIDVSGSLDERLVGTVASDGERLDALAGNPAQTLSPSLAPPNEKWRPLSVLPGGRENQTAVWTGSQMIVWGGDDGSVFVDTGGKYDPWNDTWTDTSTVGSPSPRFLHEAVWTGSRMVVWGGSDLSLWFRTGGSYDPVGNRWTPTSTAGAPAGRVYFTAVLTGSRMVVWGGNDGSLLFNSGGKYDPVHDSWTPTSTVGAPEARAQHAAVWTGSLMLVQGGRDGPVYHSNGGRYAPGR